MLTDKVVISVRLHDSIQFNHDKYR